MNDGSILGVTVGTLLGSTLGRSVGEAVGRMKMTAAAVRRLVVVTDANCTLPDPDTLSSSAEVNLRPVLRLPERVEIDSAHEQVMLVVVKDTVVHTSSAATSRVLDESAIIRPHVGATTTHGQVCVYVYAGDLPLQIVDKTVPSGQVLVKFLAWPISHVLAYTLAVSLL